MPDLVQLTPFLWVLPCRALRYNAGVLCSAGYACLIDPGLYPDELSALARLVEAQAAVARTIVLTHSHWDHIVGVQDFPGAEVVAQAEYPCLVKAYETELLHEIRRWYEQVSPLRGHLFTLPVPDRTFAETMTLGVGDLILELLHAPGHATDQCMVYHAPSGMLWAADMLSDQEIPFVSDSLTTYERTLERVTHLDIQVLIPGHGTATTDRGEIQSRLATDRSYLAELRKRVEQALGAGMSLEETIAACASMDYRYPTENHLPHRLNVESVYVELGGTPETPSVGWQPMM